MSSEHPSVRISNEIEVSRNDDREYKCITLDNGLQALLISDSSADITGAAMDVNVGHFSDPAEIPGLAHFCEHMLFLGTAKYPKENEYNVFLNENGGHSNAYTAKEHTCYYFEVQHKGLSGALDRFAQFFISPLFTASCTERELKAVDAEHSKNLQNDARRMFQLEKSTSDPDHPYFKFATGDSKTLRDIPSKEGIDVRGALIAFHAKHYLASRMKLSVNGRESLQVLEDMVRNMFKEIPADEATASQRNHERLKSANENETSQTGTWIPKIPSQPNTVDGHNLPFRDSIDTGIIQRVVPIRDLRTLEIKWAVPPLMPHYKSKPSGYIGHLIGHEGRGSLLSYLKARGWAMSLSAGAFASDESSATIGVKIGLSSEGLDHTEDIIESVFSYIRMLKELGPQRWVWDETRRIADASFRFIPKAAPAQALPSISSDLHYRPPAHIITAGHLLWEFDSDLLTKIMDLMTPERCRISIVSKKFEEQADLSEKWYGTKYSQERISDSLLQRLRNAPIRKELHLPAPNEFIATDFKLRFEPKGKQNQQTEAEVNEQAEAIVGEQNESASESLDQALSLISQKRVIVPKILRDDEHGLVMWHGDDWFGEPKASIRILYNFPSVFSSPRNLVLASLFKHLWTEALNEFAYDASVADLHYAVSIDSPWIGLYVEGFSDKLNVLLKRVLEETMPYNGDGKRKFPTEFVNKDKFEQHKERMMRQLRSFDKEMPIARAVYEASYATEQPHWHIHERLSALENIEMEDLVEFLPQLLSQAYVQSLIYGNFNETEARDLTEMIVTPFEHMALLPAEMTTMRSVQLPPSSDWRIVLPAPNAEEDNCAVCMSLQIGPDTLELGTLTTLMSNVMSEPAFHELRTQQALGYIVFARSDVKHGTISLQVLVQSNKVDGEELEERIRSFLAGFRRHLADMTEESFKSHKAAAIADRLKAVKSLHEETSHVWSEIIGDRWRFDRATSSAKFLSDVTKQDLVNYYDKYIALESSKRRTLTVLIEAGKPPSEVAGEPTEDSIKPPSFRSIELQEALSRVLGTEEGTERTVATARSPQEIDLLRSVLPQWPAAPSFFKHQFRNQHGKK